MPPSMAKNHGIPEDTIGAAVNAGKQFFSLPNDEKSKVSEAPFHLSILLTKWKSITASIARHTEDPQLQRLYRAITREYQSRRKRRSP